MAITNRPPSVLHGTEASSARTRPEVADAHNDRALRSSLVRMAIRARLFRTPKPRLQPISSRKRSRTVPPRPNCAGARPDHPLHYRIAVLVSWLSHLEHVRTRKLATTEPPTRWLRLISVPPGSRPAPAPRSGTSNGSGAATPHDRREAASCCNAIRRNVSRLRMSCRGRHFPSHPDTAPLIRLLRLPSALTPTAAYRRCATMSCGNEGARERTDLALFQ